MHNDFKKNIRACVISVAILIVLGFVFVYSSSSVFALETFGNTFYFVKKQFVGLVLGIVIIVMVQNITLATLKALVFPLFTGSLVLTGLTLVPTLAHQVHGSSRWLYLGSFTFQPSELLKVGLVLYLAHFISRHANRNSFMYGLLPVLVLLLLISFILLKQPDFGLTVAIIVTAFVLLFVAQFELKYTIFSLVLLIPLGILLILARPYRLQRILTFLNPWADPQGAGFQIIQSLIAIGSGGLWGVGIAQSRQKFFYLPMQHTDFIFSIIAEETGFIGSLIVIGLFIALLYNALKIAQYVKDQFSQLVIIGFSTLIGLQAFIHIAVTSGLLPTKGIGLPFISYGNSALIADLLMVGIILKLAHSSIKSEIF